MSRWAPTALVLAAAAASPAAARPAQPNILFVLVDDLGFADLSVTGSRRVSTPNIDRLAREGLLMTQFSVAAPICSPSRAAFLTGQFPARLRFVNFVSDRAHNARTGQADWLDPGVPTLARSLAGIGYATGHFGKWHLGGGRDIGDAPLPTAYGFDESYVQFEGLGPRVLITEDHYGLSSRSAALGRGPIDRLPKAETTDRYVDKALDFVRRHRDRPWFVQIAPDDVHDPWAPNPAQLAAVAARGRTADEDRFLATLAAMDRALGRLFATLAAEGELDDTILILTGDNGPTAAERYYAGGVEAPGETGGRRGRKGSLYQGGVAEPLLVRWPGHVPAGRRDDTTVANAVDLFPTLAALTGAPAPAVRDGIDLGRAWAGRPLRARSDLFYAYGGFGKRADSPAPHRARDRSPTFAIRSGDWKLLSDLSGAPAQLFDLTRDRSEARDVASRRPRLAARLRARLARWAATLPEELRRKVRRSENERRDLTPLA